MGIANYVEGYPLKNLVLSNEAGHSWLDRNYKVVPQS